MVKNIVLVWRSCFRYVAIEEASIDDIIQIAYHQEAK